MYISPDCYKQPTASKSYHYSNKIMIIISKRLKTYSNFAHTNSCIIDVNQFFHDNSARSLHPEDNNVIHKRSYDFVDPKDSQYI